MFARLRSMWSAAARRQQFEDEMRAEMQFHLHARIDDLSAQGMSRAAAERQARMEFGAVDAIKDDCRQSRGLRLIDTTIEDVRYALRLMRRSPGITSAAIVSLALGIGANTAIFTFVDAILLRSLPLRDPQRLFYLAHGSGDNPGTSSNYGLFERYAALSNVFDGVTAYSTMSVKVPTNDGLENVDAMWVSGNFHALLGIPMAAGLGFATETDRAPQPSLTAVISHGYWTRRFGRSPDVIGQTLIVNNHLVTIIGVTAPAFVGMTPGTTPDITLPLSLRRLDEPQFLDARDTWTSMAIIARLSDDAAGPQALAAADVAFKQYMSEKENHWMMQRSPDAFSAARLIPASKGSNALRQRYALPLMVLMAMVALILLIAAANVANLMLVRGAARSREVAIRQCVGGGRARLVRQFLTESLLLSLCGAVAGFALAIWGIGAIMALFDTLESPPQLDVAPNLRVLIFTATVTVVTGVLFGLLPAFKSTRVDLTPALKDGGARSGASRRWISGHALLVSQLALGVVVIAVAALLARSLYNLRATDAGFRPDRVLVFTLDSNGTQLSGDQRLALYHSLLRRLRELPGVTTVAASRSVPIHTAGNSRALEMPGPPETMSQRAAFTNVVTPGYFQTFGIRLIRGRDFNDGDRKDGLRVAVINQAMARLYFGERDPMGQTFAFLKQSAKPHTVVGIVADTHQMNLRDPAPAAVFTPLSQESEVPASMNFDVRTEYEPTAIAAAAIAAARSITRDVVIRYVRTMDQQIDASLARERLLASLSLTFAVLALVLVAVGLYGVLSYTVSRRSRDIGIRMALGARRRSVLWDVMRQALIVSLAGISIGVLTVLLTAHYLSTLLFGLSERDPMTLLSVVVTLLLTATVAGFFPARRAATIDPVRAIKIE